MTATKRDHRRLSLGRLGVVAVLAALAVAFMATLAREGDPSPDPTEAERTAQRRANLASLQGILADRGGHDTTIEPLWNAPLRLRVRRCGGPALAIAVELYSKTLAMYFPQPLKDVREDPGLGPRATIALLDRDGDALVDAYSQPALDDPCGASVPVGASERPGLQFLWDEVVRYAVRERR